MQLDGIHHITCITADAPGNVDFYVRLLGLRMVKKTVNFDAPEVYHLYYGAQDGAPGSVMTFFEFPGAVTGRAGAGMVHTIAWRVAPGSVAFWEQRLAGAQVTVEPIEGGLRFPDPEGLTLEIREGPETDAALAATAPDIPADHTLRGFAGARAYSPDPEASAPILTDVLEMTGSG